MFNYVLDKGEFPEQWASGLITQVRKGKTPLTLITTVGLLPLLGKLFEILVDNRITFMKEALQMSDNYNGGFQKARRPLIILVLGCIGLLH